MEQNIVVVMLDEEISRLRQVRTILQSLVVMEARVAPLLDAAAETETEEVEIEADEPEETPAQPLEVSAPDPAPVRHVSRRGIRTGKRGPRPKEAAKPRPLDAAVPQAPVVVAKSSLVARKPAETVAPAAPAPEATLEAWVRSFKQSQASA